MICIVDYGVGNLGAIANMLKRLGKKVIITSNPNDIAAADKLILPGVGAFDYAVNELHRTNLYQVLDHLVMVEKKPILGVCLGMQLMTNFSNEGELQGFGWIDAEVKKFEFDQLKVPHMGWSKITHNGDKTLTFTNNLENERYYFVHSYYVSCNDPSDIMYTSTYGNEFVCGFNKDNIFGVQFHPEKSHRFGMQLLKSFCEMNR